MSILDIDSNFDPTFPVKNQNNDSIQFDLNWQAIDNAVEDLQNNKLWLSGGTMTGSLILANDPTSANEAATKNYVDNNTNSISTLNDINDVDATSPTLNQVLTWDGSNWVPQDNIATNQNVFETINSDSGSTTADSATDTFTISGGTGITTSITGDTITLNGFSGNYNDLTNTPSIPVSIDDLSDVDTSSIPPNNGEALIWDGSQWIPGAVSGSGIQEVVEDTTPQLGGDLDAQGFFINNLADPTTDNQAATKDYVDSNIFSGDYNDLTNTPTVPSVINDLNDVDTVSTSPSINDILQWDGSNWVPQALTTVQSLDDLNDVNTSGQTSGNVLTYDGANWVPQDPSGIENIVEDTSPQLGGDLDAQGFFINNLADPTTNNQAATKDYVDNVVSTANNLVEEQSGFIESPQDKTYTLVLDAKFSYVINEITHQTGAGTLNLDIEINGTPASPSSISVGISKTTTNLTSGNTVSAGDTVTLVISGSSSPSDFAFTIQTTRT